MLKDTYEFESRDIYSNDLVDNPPVIFKVVTIPSGSSIYKVYSKNIIEAFNKRGIEITPVSFSTVTFVKKLSYNDQAIESKIHDAFLKHYAPYEIKINAVRLKPTSNTDLSNYMLQEIELTERDLEDSSGTFRVIFMSLLGHKKSIFFRYDVDATLKVFVAREDINGNEPLSPSMYKESRLALAEVRGDPAQSGDLVGAYSKSYIKEGKVITKNFIKKLPDIKRGDRIVVTDKTSGFSVQSIAEALDNGSKGDVIRVKLSNGKAANVIITGKNQAEVR